MSLSKGKATHGSGGETSKPEDRRADSVQATKGTKRRPEDENLGDIDQCLMNMLTEDRVKCTWGNKMSGQF